MSTVAKNPDGGSEVAILGRLFVNSKTALTPERAHFLLSVDFSDEDKKRMQELAAKNQHGGLSDVEREEFLGFAKAGCLVGILHSRARRALRKSNGRHRSE